MCSKAITENIGGYILSVTGLGHTQTQRNPLYSGALPCGMIGICLESFALFQPLSMLGIDEQETLDRVLL